MYQISNQLYNSIEDWIVPNNHYETNTTITYL